MKMEAISVRAAVSAVFLFSSLTFAHGFDLSIGVGRHDGPGPAVVTAKKNGPPDHAPAHGYRAKHRYHYYPSSSVYFDEERGLYFYISGSGWRVSASLPHELNMRLGGAVSLELDTDKPYIYHDRHQMEYPPKNAKKGNKHKYGIFR